MSHNSFLQLKHRPKNASFSHTNGPAEKHFAKASDRNTEAHQIREFFRTAMGPLKYCEKTSDRNTEAHQIREFSVFAIPNG